MAYFFIINPAAGHGRAAKEIHRLHAAAARAGLEYSLEVTKGPEHAAELACAAALAQHTVIAVGGDGTIHEIACGLIRSRQAIPLGMIPVGTGNDFASFHGVTRDVEQAVEGLRDSVPVAIDYGVVRWRTADGAGTRPFVNAMGAGLDARVADEAAAWKALPGTAAYLAALPGVLRRWVSPEVRITSDPGGALYAGPLLLMTAANGATSGGGFRLTPRARMDDGLLDVCFVRHLSPARAMRLVPRVLRGIHETAPEIGAAQVRTISMESSAPLTIHTDGEIVTREAIYLDATIVPGGLNVLLPDVTL